MDKEEYQKLNYTEKVEAIINDPKAFRLPQEAVYVAQYVANLRPCVPPVNTPDNLTSMDIFNALIGVCDTDINTISAVMHLLGFRLIVGGSAWSAKRLVN